MSANSIRSLVFLGLALMWPCLAWAALPTITRIIPAVGTIADQVQIEGTNFNNVSQVKLNGFEIPYTRYSATKIGATVPYWASTGPITVTTREGTAESAQFTVTIGVAPTTKVGPPTGTVTLQGLAFQPHAAVDVYFDTTHWGLVLARSDGRFSFGFKVPAKALPGTHWISAVQRNSGLGGQADFTVRTDWAQFHLDGANRYNRFENVLNPANVEDLSLAATGDALMGDVTSPIVVGDNVWVVNSAGYFLIFSRPEPGKQTLTYRCGRYSPADAVFGSPAAGRNGDVYFGTSNNRLYAGKCNYSGVLVWSWYGITGGSISSSPAVSMDNNEMVFVGSSDSKLYAFKSNCATGGRQCSPVWKGATGAPISSSPAVAGGVVYVGSEDGKLYAFRVDCGSGGADCTPSWIGATGSAIRSSPAVAGGVVYVGSGDGKLHAFKVGGCGLGGGSACTPLWSGVIGMPGSVISSSPAVAGNVVYIGSDDGKLYAFKVGCGMGGASCTPLWTGATGSAIGSSPAVAGGLVFVGSHDGRLYAFKAKCGTGGAICEPLWTGLSNSGGTSPVVADGVVYAGSNNGKLYAFDLSSGPLSMAKAQARLGDPAPRPHLEDLKPDPAVKPVSSQ